MPMSKLTPWEVEIQMTLKTIRRVVVAGVVGTLSLVTVPVHPAHADNQNCGLIPVTNCQYSRTEHHHEGGNSGDQQQQQGSAGGGGGGGSSSSSSAGSSGSGGGGG